MTLSKIEKQIETIENSISKLSRKLNLDNSTKTEKELIKNKSILHHLERIRGILTYQ